MTTNLPFEQWTEILMNERLTGALFDRITHRVHVIKANGENFASPGGRYSRATQALNQYLNTPY